jgi:lysozyme
MCVRCKKWRSKEGIERFEGWPTQFCRSPLVNLTASERRRVFAGGRMSNLLIILSLRAAALLVVLLPCVAAAEDLVDDYSRGDMLRYAMSVGPNVRAVPDHFSFPDDALSRSKWFFGTDVSHYDGVIDWAKASKQGIGFAYVKATQGVQSTDNTFARNWANIAKVWGDETTRVYRGAYHFLSAEGDAKAQAQHFLSNLGPVLSTDLPPSVDVEWDAPPHSADLDAADRWKGLSAAAIIAKMQTWLEVVEQATGKTPVIYTQPRWWNNRIGKTEKLAKYQIWIADYSTKSQLSEVPQTPAGYPVHLWQFSENGRAKDGFSTNIDVNVFKGTRDEFLTALAAPK